MRMLVLAALVSATFSAHPMSDEWIELASTKNGTLLYHKQGSLKVFNKGTQQETSEAIVSITKDDKIEFRRAVVEVNDCRAGYGQVKFIAFGKDGSSSNADFVMGAGTLASAVADLLCK